MSLDTELRGLFAPEEKEGVERSDDDLVSSLRRVLTEEAEVEDTTEEDDRIVLDTERRLAELPPEERRRAGAGLGENVPADVPDLDHIEATRQDSMDEYRRQIESKSTWWENLRSDLEREILPTMGSIVGSIYMTLLPIGKGAKFAQALKSIFGAGVGGAGGEGLQMANEYMRGDSDAPETLGEATGRAGRVGAREALWEFGGISFVRVGSLLLKAGKAGLDKSLSVAEDLARRVPVVREVFETMDRTRYAGIKAANERLAKQLADDTLTNLPPQQVGDTLKSVARKDSQISNHVIKQHMYEIDSAPGLSGRVGPPGAEKIAPNSVNMVNVQEYARNRLTPYTDRTHVRRPESRRLAAEVQKQLDEIGESTGFAGAFAAQTEVLEVARRTALDMGDENLARHFKAIQNRIKLEMDTTAARIGGETESHYKHLTVNPEKTMSEINESYMIDIAVNNPRLVGTQMHALTPEETANFKKTLQRGLSKEEFERTWTDIGHGHLTDFVQRVVDPETGRVNFNEVKRLQNDPKQRRINVELYGEEAYERIGGIMKLMEEQARKPGSYLLESTQLYNYIKSRIGMGSLGGVTAAGVATALDPTGIVAGAVGTAVGAGAVVGSVPTLAALARATGATAETVSRWSHEIVAMLMTDPQHAKVLADALRFGPDHPKAATIMAQLNAAILEAADVIAFREADSIDEALGLSREEVTAPTDTSALPPGAVLIDNRAAEGRGRPLQSGGLPPGAELVENPNRRREARPSPKTYQGANEQEWILSYQQANPGATRTQAIKAGKQSGNLPKDYKDPPRGIRNNNPGNIRISDTNWQGKVEGHDSSFETFKTPEHGIRAMAVNLQTYSRVHGLNTVGQIISRWAPPNENATGSYINTVARRMGVKPNERLNLNDPKVMRELIKAIIYVENGSNPYDDKLVDKGIRMATKKA